LIAADDHLAHYLAAEAGRRLLSLRERADFSDQTALRGAGDRLSHEYLTAALAAHRHGDALLSEEGEDDLGRVEAHRVWIVDPLDGTREFGEAGRTDWAVHVALWARAAGQVQADDASDGAGLSGGRRAAAHPSPHNASTGRLVAGAVALPAQGKTYSTAPHGLDGVTRPAADDARRLRIVVSRTRAPEFVRLVAAEMGADLIPLGSAGAKIIAVVTGAADAYIHSGGMYEWDSAAPVAVAHAAGLHASRIDGRPLVYNRPDPRLPDILVCRSEIAAMLLAAIGPRIPRTNRRTGRS
jgi:3'(2'), 5'-bisphosphate nucleotidase